MQKIEKEEDFEKLLDSLKKSSTMTWQHINMLGEYDFAVSTEEESFNIDNILKLNIEKFIL